MQFFVGIHHPSDARHFKRCFISINTLRRRTVRCGTFVVNDWIMDSGAFSTLAKYGRFPHSVGEYAAQIRRWAENGSMLAAVSQDYMCEPDQLKRTGLTIAEHQRLTVKRYDALVNDDTGGVHVMPVLQGYAAEDYISHIRQYGNRLIEGMWVAVGSVCKCNSNQKEILALLRSIHRERPDLKLHGLGLKGTALAVPFVARVLHSADSMAWSYGARKLQTGKQNDWREAKRWCSTFLPAEQVP